MLPLLTLLACSGSPARAIPHTEATVATAYKAWLGRIPGGAEHTRHLKEEGDVVVRKAELPGTPKGVTLWHGGGSYEGGHRFYPSIWMWEQANTLHFFDRASVQNLDERGAKHALKEARFCDAGGTCMDVLPKLGDAAPAELTGLVLRWSHDGWTAEPVDAGTKLNPYGEELRWWGDARPGDIQIRKDRMDAAWRVGGTEPGRTIVQASVAVDPMQVTWTTIGEVVVHIE